MQSNIKKSAVKSTNKEIEEEKDDEYYGDEDDLGIEQDQGKA